MGLLDFFRPKWKHSNAQVRQTAVEQLEEQSVLAKIATNDESYPVRLAAVGKLNDESVLAKIATNDESYPVRLAAVGMLQDQSVLADIARTADADTSVRCAAVRKIKDEKVLAELERTTHIFDIVRAEDERKREEDKRTKHEKERRRKVAKEQHRKAIYAELIKEEARAVFEGVRVRPGEDPYLVAGLAVLNDDLWQKGNNALQKVARKYGLTLEQAEAIIAEGRASGWSA